MRPLPRKDPSHADRCSSPVSRPQGWRRSSRPQLPGQSDPGPDPLLPDQPGSDPLPLPLPLPLPRPPPPPAPRPVPARVIVQSTTASLRPHGTGSSKRYRDALCWGGRLTTTPRGQRGRISGHFSSQVDRDSRAEVAGPAVLEGRVGPGICTVEPAAGTRPTPPRTASGRHEGLAGAAGPCPGAPGLALLVPGLEPHGNPASLVRGRP